MASSSGKSKTYRFLDAAMTGNLSVLKRLANELDVGEGLAKTVVSIKNPNGHTAFHYAAMAGKTHVCKYLVEELKLDIDMKDKKGQTPLHHAILEERYPAAVYLLENGANPDAATDQGRTALHCAAHNGLKKLIRLLISKGAKVDAKADCGTPLQDAAAQGKKEAVRILLDNHANPNVVVHHIYTPLVASILAESFECVKILLQAGADPNTRSCGGVTPIGIASSEGKTEIIKCLLNAGADPNVTNFYGLTPIEVSALVRNHEGVMILFPVTSRIPTIPDWSVGGIIKYVHSEKAKEERMRKVKENFVLLKSNGENAVKRKDYHNAIYWYTEAINADPTDATVLSNRSLCWARLNEGSLALTDAEACVALRPDWAKAYYREAVAYKLLKDYVRSADSFAEALKLDPENEELQKALGEAVRAEVDSLFVRQETGNYTVGIYC